MDAHSDPTETLKTPHTHLHTQTHTKKEGYPAGCHFWLSFQLSTQAEGQRDARVEKKGRRGWGGHNEDSQTDSKQMVQMRLGSLMNCCSVGEEERRWWEGLSGRQGWNKLLTLLW